MVFSATEPLPVTQHRLFSAAECADIQQRVLDLREHWIKRPANGFYSLATAAYLDAPGRRGEYRQHAQETNPLLLEKFSDVYATVTEFFEQLLFAPVRMTDEAALPGFHIFELGRCGPDGDPSWRRVHFDLQRLDAFPSGGYEATLSFTVAIQQPPSGAAMDVWPLRYADALLISMPITEWAATHPSRRMGYADGGITVHDGDVLHAIGSRSPADPPGRRLTLQGHGVLLDGAWILYW
jgi:hypothetical protein